MLTDSLGIYFHLNDRWYLGSKKSLRWLKQHNPHAYHLIQKVLDEPYVRNHVTK
ncbi:hypothetical protein [Halobacillus seohaensis]|uniref:hypothetical protein n=1 Tax=Halobacillus seohaensis TaxID=447421 RepID=UPI0036F42A45